MARNEMVLSLFLSQWGGTHPGAWRVPGSPQNPATDFDHVRTVVQTAERGKLHTIFLADNHAIYPQRDPVVLARTANAVKFEPFTLCSALAVCTSHIGLALTVSTTYNEPYHVARKFSSLDRISGGRASWNVVISGNPDDSQNFGFDTELDTATRYRRADEFVDVVKGLWDSWDPDAFTRDKNSGQYFDVEKMHRLEHLGEFFTVRGPLNADRLVQGYPVIAQAGASPTGLEFASRIADMVFGVGLDLAEGKLFYDDVKRRAEQAGRHPDDVLVMTGITAVLGRTQAEADRRAAEFDALADPIAGLDRLIFAIHHDISTLPLDGPLPDDIPITEHGPAAIALQERYLRRAREEKLSIRELARIACGDLIMPLGVREMADYMEEHFATTADGFNLSFGDSIESLELFVSDVVPELQRRGIFHTDYAGTTLRENLGLEVPTGRYGNTQ